MHELVVGVILLAIVTIGLIVSSAVRGYQARLEGEREERLLRIERGVRRSNERRERLRLLLEKQREERDGI